jgi:hypothetical protein
MQFDPLDKRIYRLERPLGQEITQYVSEYAVACTPNYYKSIPIVWDTLENLASQLKLLICQISYVKLNWYSGYTKNI